MTADYKRFLAERVLNEQQAVTYHSLSRALKVHSTLAKRMLYEFHRVENSSRPNSVNATYVVTGIQQKQEKLSSKRSQAKDGDDEIMQSSPFTSSQMLQEDELADSPQVTAITLVREEELADAKTQFHTIFSVFVYSIQPTSLRDLNVLSDVGHELLVSQPEDPLKYGRQYGMIQNNNVKRRTGITQLPQPRPAESDQTLKLSILPGAPKPAGEERPPESEIGVGDLTSKSLSQLSTKSQASVRAVGKPISLKRDKSDIFKAFAKAKPKNKNLDPEPTGSSGRESAEPSGSEDVVFGDTSEEEREDLFLDTGTRSSNKARQSRKEREEKLKKLFADDEEMADAPEVVPDEPETLEVVPMEESSNTESREEAPPVPRGRRRGRRQVMKKTTVKDEEGYLVTREEPIWESFSEDEPELSKRKPPISAALKPAKGGSKPGQGNIMSFFGKR